jgi:H/ACA ribonucleoprotein complex subunit 4
MGLLPFERMDRSPIIRQADAKTSDKFGCYPEKRSVAELLEYGIINLDKPSGPSSHQVSSYVQGILKIKKSGHSGTLDPGVTGVLPVALGNGTRVVQSLLSAGKEYICLMRLHKEYSKEEVLAVLEKFTGKLRQLPPVKSAVKREWRYRTVYYNEFLDMQGTDVLFRCGCQAGTYMRKICHDIGVALGSGAHMQELRRTKAGPFMESSTVTLHDVKDAFSYWEEYGDEKQLRRCVLPLEHAVAHLPKVVIADTTVNSITQGATLKVRGIVSVEANIQVGELAAIMTLKGELVAVGEAMMISKDMVKKEAGVAVKSSQVFMQPGVYPKM